MMQRSRRIEEGRQAAATRGAEQSAPRSSPLTIISGAVAGDDLSSLAASASAELGQPVVIAMPRLGEPIVSSDADIPARVLAEYVKLATDAVCRGGDLGDDDAVPILLGEETVGIVAAVAVPDRPVHPDARAWLEGVATAAAVTSLLRDTRAAVPERSRAALIRALTAASPSDLAVLLSEASRLGLDFTGGGVAVVARGPAGSLGANATFADRATALLAELTPGRVAGLVPRSSSDAVDEVLDALEARGLECARSGPRRNPADLHDAMREAELMLELRTPAAGQEEETYRLLVGVLVRDPDEVELLRARTISPLVVYDSRHDTELVATVSAFLAHHGSTSETADAMGLHRHTVGYRLARVHEVSGLSPYESDGRERLSLGLKAHQILEAHWRLSPPR